MRFYFQGEAVWSTSLTRWHRCAPLAPLCLAAAVAAKFRIRGMSIDNPSKPPFEKGGLVKGKPLIGTLFNGAGELWWSPDNRLPT